MSDSNWIEALRAAVAASSMTVVAGKLGLSRTAVSLVLAGKYGVSRSRPQGASTASIERRVRLLYGPLQCPAEGQPITPDACRQHREAKAPINNPVAMLAWRACRGHCRTCQYNPSNTSKEKCHDK